MKRFSVLAFAVLLFSVPVSAAEVGQAAPEFSLQDIQGKTHALSEHKGKIVVLEWTNFECPFVKKHYGSANMQALQGEYTGRGVVWFSVNSSAAGKQGNFPAGEWQERAAAWKSAATAILLDPDGVTGRAYGAKTTPHLFIIDADGTLLYKGAIDDKASADPGDIPDAKNYARQALDEALAGKPVSEAQTQSYGCSVKY